MAHIVRIHNYMYLLSSYNHPTQFVLDHWLHDRFGKRKIRQSINKIYLFFYESILKNKNTYPNIGQYNENCIKSVGRHFLFCFFYLIFSNSIEWARFYRNNLLSEKNKLIFTEIIIVNTDNDNKNKNKFCFFVELFKEEEKIVRFLAGVTACAIRFNVKRS